MNGTSIAEYLLGKNISIQEACIQLDIDYDSLTGSDYAGIDYYIYRCPECRYWVQAYDTVENSFGEKVCYECGAGR